MRLSVSEDQSSKRLKRLKILIACCVVTGLLIVVFANIHLAYVAIQSQPDCVSHLKSAGSDGAFRAAKSSC